MIIQDALDRIRKLESRNPRSILLARACSFAVLIDPQLMRKLRLELVPGTRAIDEADLWFSRLVQSRNAEGIVIYPEVAEQLRQDLLQKDVDKAWQITQELHKELPSAIRVEEELAFLSRNAEANRGRIEELLREAISKMIAGQKTELANWAGRALSRMPASIQATEPATVLAIASDLRLGRNGLLEERLAGKSRIPEWLSAALPNLGKIKIGVRLTSEGIEFGPAAEYPAVIEVPDTRPAMVEVRWTEADSVHSSLVFIEPGERTAPRPAGSDAVQLLTLANQLYTLEPKPGTAIQTYREGLVARAYSESYAAQICWSATGPIKGCLGFALERRTTPSNTPIVLEQFLNFSPGKASSRTPTTLAPIQRFSWRDVPHTRDVSSASYRVIPIGGSANNTQRMDHLASNWTAPVFFRPNEDGAISVYFNRSLVKSQSAEELISASSPEKSANPPLEEIPEPEGLNDENGIRKVLGGDLLRKLIFLLQQALAMKGSVYAALYDLDDPELLSTLAHFGYNANVLLAETRVAHQKAGESFVHLKKNGVRIFRRVLPRSRLSHNKFLVICDNQQKPVRVWTGNTSWIQESLCLRSNAAVVIESAEVASFFLDQWKRLVEAKDAFPAALLASNSMPKKGNSAGGARVTVQFTPVRHMEDLRLCERLIGNAQEGILYIASESGRRSSLLEAIQNAKNVYVCGLQRRGPSVTLYKQGRITNVSTNVNLVPKAELSAMTRSSAWLKNLTRFGTASVQSRMIVIDPFSDHSIVITGSHGFSLAASTRNDENLVIIENAPEMAIQCATYIAGLYDRHDSRAAAKKSATSHPSRLQPDDAWQKRYETPQARQEMYFWMGARRKKLSPEQPLQTVDADTDEIKISKDAVNKPAPRGTPRKTQKPVPGSVRRNVAKKAASKKNRVGKKKSTSSRKSSSRRALTRTFSSRSAAKKSRKTRSVKKKLKRK
ncbi:MAG TPA: hypothetical protein VHQ22_12380 [Terriglobales bacterium]|jgi:phosphatidylserine/phosphatidylglycerophosphate/cardiolipin synthase-like enzyme|nr:hypothetical protein [Terriglobales bacterium]